MSVVIPAAGEARRMAGVLASGAWGLPKAMLEVGRRPVIVEILEGIEAWADRQGLSPRYQIVTGDGGGKLRRFLRAYYRGRPLARRLVFRRQRRATGPLTGVLSARPGPGPLLIWLCDTLVPGGLGRFEADALYTAAVEGDLRRWCLARSSARGRLRALADKTAPLSQKKGQALIGVYSLSDAELFWRLGRRLVRARKRRAGEFQLSSALELYHLERPLKARPVARWLDTGMPETFLEAKEFCLERLDGHRVALDPGRRAVLKRRAEGVSEKDLALEAAWFRAAARAQPRLRPALPTGLSLRGGELRLDYKDWPSLSDWYLYRSYYLPKAGERAFRDFLAFVRGRLHRPAALAPERRAQASWAMLAEKTERRLARVPPRLLSRRWTLNGRRLGSWTELRPKFLALARRFAPSEAKDWTTLHGDLVFSNVLADGRGGFCLLDPRGAYGSPGLSGDRYYDYAKIAQCVLSQYDSIKKGEFELGGSGDRRSLAFPRAKDPGRALWRSAFLKFCWDEGLHMERLRFFEACLLLSLLPLHLENPDQVLAAYLGGLGLVADLALT